MHMVDSGMGTDLSMEMSVNDSDMQYDDYYDGWVLNHLLLHVPP